MDLTEKVIYCKGERLFHTKKFLDKARAMNTAKKKKRQAISEKGKVKQSKGENYKPEKQS